jgi:hypothetical protein
MENYMQIACSKITIPLVPEDIYKKTTNVAMLKVIAKSYKLKISGTKKELIGRIELFLKLSHFAKKIQNIFRKFLKQKCKAAISIQQLFRKRWYSRIKQLRGPAVIFRRLCNNEFDFLTGDLCKDIPIHQFFSFRDIDGFVYGFDLQSVFNLKQMKNPYNRNPIDVRTITNMKTLIKLCRFTKTPLRLDVAEKTKPKTVEQRIVEIFQVMDSLGNYTSATWLLELSNPLMLRFLRELNDIWNYRSQITMEIKRQICPPYGDPFRGHGQFYYIDSSGSRDSLRLGCVTILESMILHSVDDDSKTLGVYFILSALTLVSQEAAVSLPWLFDAVH